jgi:hypothetical protein
MNALPSLRELQRGVADALFGRGDAVERWIVGAGLESAARLRIYRNAVASTQIEALRTSYPAVLALVGAEFFEATAARFRLAHPSTSGNLQAFGDAFGEYLASLPEARSLDYLADVARLEWLRQESALAADAAPLDGNALMSALATDPERLWLSLHPSVRLLSSSHPVQTIWLFAHAPTADGLRLDSVGEQGVVWRVGQDVAVATLHRASFAMVAALADGQDLDSAHRLALAADADFDLAECLRSLIAQEIFSDFHIEPRPQ